jgi:acetyl esterase
VPDPPGQAPGDELDPQVRRVLDGAPDEPPPATVEEARARYERDARRWAGEPEPVACVEDADLGGGVRVRVYRPAGARGAVLYVHGGGWVLGSVDSHDPLCRALANRAGAAVVSVDYRRAPETPFPGPVDDGERALRWTASRFPGEPLAVAGDSAGGTIATVLARRARDAGGPALRFQLLIYPATDAACATASHLRYGRDERYGLTRAQMRAYWADYAPGASARSPDASPLRAADLSGLPPALLVLAACDPLVDEGEDYAERMRAAGVPVEVRTWPGMAHGFIRWTGAVEAARRALDEAAARLRAAFVPAR